jgi:hypothetical protein
MEKESLIEKSDNLSDIEKAVIEVELEKKLTHELLESKEKDEFMSQATENPNYPSGSTTEKSLADQAIENLDTKLEATTEISLGSSTMSEIEKEKVDEIFNELQEENLDTNLEATTEGINLGSSTDKSEVDVLENQVQGRKKRDIHSIGRTIRKTIAEEAMEISEATLDDPNAFSRKTKRAEDIYFLRVFYKVEATTENNLLGSSADKNEVDASENQVQRRKKRDVHSIGRTIGETIVEEAMEISKATLDDPNASSRETERAEELFVYSKDLIENLEAIDKSDISDKEKTEIENKLEGDAIDEAAEAVQDLADFNEPPDSKEAIEKQVKENLESFLEDVDIQR